MSIGLAPSIIGLVALTQARTRARSRSVVVGQTATTSWEVSPIDGWWFRGTKAMEASLGL